MSKHRASSSEIVVETSQSLPHICVVTDWIFLPAFHHFVGEVCSFLRLENPSFVLQRTAVRECLHLAEVKVLLIVLRNARYLEDELVGKVRGSWKVQYPFAMLPSFLQVLVSFQSLSAALQAACRAVRLEQQ